MLGKGLQSLIPPQDDSYKEELRSGGEGSFAVSPEGQGTVNQPLIKPQSNSTPSPQWRPPLRQNDGEASVPLQQGHSETNSPIFPTDNIASTGLVSASETDEPFAMPRTETATATDGHTQAELAHEPASFDQVVGESVKPPATIEQKDVIESPTIISDTALAPAEELSKSHPVFQIETARIRSNPYQPREQYDEEQLEELAASIREYGILQPLVVTRLEQETPAGVRIEYELIAGERRLLASRKLGLDHVPAIVKEEPRDQREKLEMALIENIQRANLNPLESARAYARLQDEFGLSQREVAQRLGKSRESVANTIRLLQLPRETQHALSDGRITESHARILLQAPDPEEQRALLFKITEHQLSVRDTKMLIDTGGDGLTSGGKAKSFLPDPQLEFVKKQLEEVLGTRVKVVRRGQKGKITISFYSEEELQGLVDRLI